MNAALPNKRIEPMTACHLFQLVIVSRTRSYVRDK